MQVVLGTWVCSTKIYFALKSDTEHFTNRSKKSWGSISSMRCHYLDKNLTRLGEFWLKNSIRDTEKKMREWEKKKEILFWNLQRSFVLQLNETIISTNVYCWYILLHFELPQIKAYENFKLITIFLMIRSWVQIPYKPEFFTRPSFHYCFSSVHNCEDCFHIHVFIRSSNIWLSYIHSCLFTTSRVYLEPTQWPAPSWLVSSVGRALHRYRRGHGFKSHTGLNFFQAFFSLLLK